MIPIQSTVLINLSVVLNWANNFGKRCPTRINTDTYHGERGHIQQKQPARRDSCFPGHLRSKRKRRRQAYQWRGGDHTCGQNSWWVGTPRCSPRRKSRPQGPKYVRVPWDACQICPPSTPRVPWSPSSRPCHKYADVKRSLRRGLIQSPTGCYGSLSTNRSQPRLVPQILRHHLSCFRYKFPDTDFIRRQVFASCSGITFISQAPTSFMRDPITQTHLCTPTSYFLYMYHSLLSLVI